MLFSAILMLLLVITGCQQPPVIDPQKQEGEMIVSITDSVSRSILPGISMEPASYDLTGSGPNGASFTQSISSGNTAVIKSLAFGQWTVSVTAKNNDGKAIGSGNGSVLVKSNDTVSLNIIVRPFDGIGSLALSVGWPHEQIQTPQIDSTLTPLNGAARVLDFTIDGTNGSANYSANDVPAGYHTLIVKLMDNGYMTIGAVEVVRIVADETTDGSIVFDNVNQATGDINIGITPEMNDPLDVTIIGAEVTKPQNQSMSLSASVSNYTDNLVYVWYINASAVATGQAFTMGNTYAKGYYRIDVTAFTPDGKRAGSDTATVQVTDAVYGSNATLSGLTSDISTLTPVFDSTINNYAIEVDNSADSIILTGVTSDPEATISANNGVAQSLNVGVNIIVVTVTAADSTTMQNYTVSVTRKTSPVTGTLTTTTLTNTIHSVGVPGGSTDLQGREVTLSPFTMGKYEITYAQWYEVKSWATTNGYNFQNAGREGHDGTAGAVPTAASSEPVTMISWRDAIVWCNALSEKESLNPCYKTAGGVVIKDSRDVNVAVVDAAVLTLSATGYRLPTEAEWEYAASYKDGTNWTPATWASGATADYNNASATGTVAWYSSNLGSKTQPVGGKTANQLGLFDMSGNVWEWCSDWYGSITAGTPVSNPTGAGTGSYRVVRGGSWSIPALLLQVGIRTSNPPGSTGDGIGFRLSRTSY